MLHLRTEGEAFKTGISLQIGGGSKVPYLSLHYVSYDLGSLIAKRYSIRFRFRLWPCILLEKREWNHIENYLRIREATLIPELKLENLLACEERVKLDNKIADRKRDARLAKLRKM